MINKSMILLDFQPIMLSNILVNAKQGIEENLVRHMVLNSIRSLNSRFRSEYGEMIICCDSTDYWRKDIFPYYKAGRKKDDTSLINWPNIFNYLNKIKEELQDVLPYSILEVEKTEADDIIGWICKNILDVPKLIVSGDKDFLQLHTSFTKQYDPIRKKYVVGSGNPEIDLQQKIIEGDPGDGIPNCYSKDSTFVEGERQVPLSKKRRDAILAESYNSEVKRNIDRNKNLIDLSLIPDYIKQNIRSAWLNRKTQDRTELMAYCRTYRLNKILESIGDF